MIKKISVYIPSVVIPMAVNMLYLLMNTNYLDSSEYGILSIYISTINLIYSFFLSFIQTASFRFYSIKEEIKDRKTFFSTYVISNLLFSVLASLCVLIFNVFIPQINFTIVGLSILVTGLYNFYTNVFRLENDYRKYTFATIFISFLKIIIYIVLILNIRRITHIHPIIAMYGSYIILVITETYKKRKDISFKYFSFELLLSSFKYAYPMIGASIMSLLLTSSDQYFILYFINESEVGLYSFGYKIADTIIINLSMTIMLVMYPILMDTYDNKSIKAAEKELTKMINLNFWIIIPIACWLVISVGTIVEIFFPNFIGAENITQNVVIVSILHSSSMFVSKGLELGKDTKRLFYDLTIAFIVNFVYNLVFIPLYGTLAAAHSSILSYLVYNILLIKHSKKYININIDFKFLFKTLIISIIVLLIPRVFNLYGSTTNIMNLIVMSSVSIILYIAISYKSKIVNKFN